MKKLLLFSGSWLAACTLIASSNLTLLPPDPDLLPPDGDPIPKEHLLELQGITNLPYVPPAPLPPPPPPSTPYDTSNYHYYVVTSYVYKVEYATNTANKIITETRTVDVPIYIERYPKLLYVQPLFRESLTNEWQELGTELIYKLGDSRSGFYSARLRIE